MSQTALLESQTSASSEIPLRGEFPIPLHVESAVAGQQPVSVGLPFPRGVLRETELLALRTMSGGRVLLQAEPLARWPDGSVKWLLLDFIHDSKRPGIERLVFCEAATPDATTKRPPLLVEESGGTIRINTGVATFRLDTTTFPPLVSVLVGDQEVIDAGSARTELTDAKGRTGTCQVNKVEIEARGPVRATIRFEGVFAGRVPCRFIARCCFFAGTGLMRMRFTIHNPNRAKHAGGLWDLGDPGSMFFRDLSLFLGCKNRNELKTSWTTEVGQPACEADELEIYQDSSGGMNWQSKNHVNRHGQVPCRFRGYRVRTRANETTGHRASPVIALQTRNGSLNAAVPEFWQQFPKAIEVDKGLLRLGLFPRQFGDVFELQGGERKTHTIWLNFATTEATSNAALTWVHQPSSVRAPSAWYNASGALPPFAPNTEDTEQQLDDILADVVGGEKSYFARREIIDEYGWRNYGEIYADHEQAYYKGAEPVISHYNNQYDFLAGALLQWLRTGDRCWLDLADPLARHVIDIDIYHTNEDKPAYNGGLFWFTDHYKSAATSTHRTYSRANCRPGDSYGGGPSCNHLFTTGLDVFARESCLAIRSRDFLAIAGPAAWAGDGSKRPTSPPP